MAEAAVILALEPPGGAPLVDRVVQAGARRGVEVIRWTPAAMIDAVTLTLTIEGAEARVSWAAGGRRIDGEAVRGVITLIDAFAPELWPRYDARDRDYAAGEALAAWSAALAALPCPVLNPPSPAALGGAIVEPAELSLRACEVGLGAPPLLYLESAAALGEEPVDEVRAIACALGQVPGASAPLGRAWLAAAGAGPVRVQGAGRERSRVVVIGEAVLAGGGAAPPGPIAAALVELHRRLGRVMGEVWLGREDDGGWLVEGAQRWPSAASVEELGERIGDALVAACLDRGAR